MDGEVMWAGRERDEGGAGGGTRSDVPIWLVKFTFLIVPFSLFQGRFTVKSWRRHPQLPKTQRISMILTYCKAVRFSKSL